MKQLFFYLFLFMYACVFSQIPASAPWIKEQTTNPKTRVKCNFDDITRDANTYFKTIDIDKKGSGYKPFKRWEEHWEYYKDSKGNIINASKVWESWKDKRAMEKRQVSTGRASSNWQSIGPTTFIDGGSWSAGQGRVNIALIDPNNPSTYYVGTPAGGLWKSTNAGNSWTCLTDNLPQIGVSGIAVDHNDSNTIYITTGDDDAGNSYFVGVMKSTDGGQTWHETGNITNGPDSSANEIYIDPNNSNVIWVATTSGLYKSTNGGDSWDLKIQDKIRDMKLKPGSSNTVYAVSSSTFYRSTDGDHFQEVQSGLPSYSGRLTIDVTPANSELVFVLSSSSNNRFQGVFKSSNSGASFQRTGQSGDIFNGSSQAWYDFAFGVSDEDPNEMYVGVLNIWKSSDGGNSFYQVNSWNQDTAPAYTHADIHFLRFYNGVLFAGTDGGVFKSTNHASSFKNLTDGLVISQFYKISVSNQSSQRIVGGLQDNGGYAYYNDQWYNYYGADGMDAAADPNNPDVSYGFIQSGSQLYRSTRGQSSQEANAPNGESGKWVTPLVADNSGALYAGYSQLYKYSGGYWRRLTNYSFNGKLNVIELDPSNSNIIFVAEGKSLYKTTNGGGNLQRINIQFSGGAISSVEVNNNNNNIVYLTTGGYDGKVYKSTDGGQSWNDISGNLPNESKNVVRHQKNSPNNSIFVGTYLGVYYLDDSSDEWSSFSTNLPNVHVTDLEVSPNERKITASTYGRGIWQSDIGEGGGVKYDTSVLDVSGIENAIGCGDIKPTVKIRNNGSETIHNFTINYSCDGQNLVENWSGQLGTGKSVEITLKNIQANSIQHNFKLEVKADQDEILENNSFEKTVYTNIFSSESEKNSFENSIEDAWLVATTRTEPGNLWEIGTPGTSFLNTVGSGSKAYITNPNGEYTDNTLGLLYTRCIDLTSIKNPMVTFKMAFDLEKDFDVVYIEYSTDKGNSWEILGTSYDKNWYNSNQSTNQLTVGKQWTGKESLKEYSYDLSDLADESNIVFRFHFESDALKNGEGVLIDDFQIKTKSNLGIEDNYATQRSKMLLFPNPTENTVQITWENNLSGILKFYDSKGQLVKEIKINNENKKTIPVKHLAKGIYIVKFENSKQNIIEKLIVK